CKLPSVPSCVSPRMARSLAVRKISARSGRVAKNARKWQSNTLIFPPMCGAILPLCLLQAILLAVGNSQPAVLPDFSAARQRMVQEQLSAPGRDIKNRLVLDAIATVPRHEFVPE